MTPTRPMIDLHCHLLPGIDDGPKDLDTSLAMCRHAIESGITHAVVTPHITPGRYDNTIESITAAYSNFKKKLAEAEIPIALGMAAEVRLDPVIMDLVRNHTMPYLGEHEDHKLILLEFPHDRIPPGSLELVTWLLNNGVRPVIAHPERNGDVQQQLNKIKPFVQLGCLLQITATSLTGGFNDISRKRAVELLKKGWVSIIASDAHNLHVRKPELDPGRKIAEKYVGETESWALVRDRPAEIAAMHFQ